MGKKCEKPCSAFWNFLFYSVLASDKIFISVHPYYLFLKIFRKLFELRFGQDGVFFPPQKWNVTLSMKKKHRTSHLLRKLGYTTSEMRHSALHWRAESEQRSLSQTENRYLLFRHTGAKCDSANAPMVVVVSTMEYVVARSSWSSCNNVTLFTGRRDVDKSAETADADLMTTFFLSSFGLMPQQQSIANPFMERNVRIFIYWLRQSVRVMSATDRTFN